MSARGVFIAGAHTHIGKTHVACALIGAARARGCAVAALKPVMSGYDEARSADSDAGRLLAALGRPATPEALSAMSPWRFAAPLAPPMAARLEGRDLPFAPIADFCRARLEAGAADLCVVEGLGGLMSPLADGATGLDLMRALNLPAILVAGSYLGAISHALTALDVLQARAMPVVCVVVSESGEADAPNFAETVASVRAFSGACPVLAAARGYGAAEAEEVLALVERSGP